MRGGCRAAIAATNATPRNTPNVLEANHAYHGVLGANGVRLGGLTITAGFADGEGDEGKGGGVINYRGAPQDRWVPPS